MKGITNATKGAADVVQDATKVSVLGVDLQEATDSQSGLMSKADHSTLSTTATRVGTCEGEISTLKSLPAIYSGSSEPSSTLGKNGDIYIKFS